MPGTYQNESYTGCIVAAWNDCQNSHLKLKDLNVKRSKIIKANETSLNESGECSPFKYKQIDRAKKVKKSDVGHCFYLFRLINFVIASTESL